MCFLSKPFDSTVGLVDTLCAWWTTFLTCWRFFFASSQQFWIDSWLNACEMKWMEWNSAFGVESWLNFVLSKNEGCCGIRCRTNVHFPLHKCLFFLWLLNYWLNVLNWIGLNVWNHVMEVEVFFLIGPDRFLNCGDRCWELSILVSSNLLPSNRTSIILHFVLDNSCLRSSVKPTHRLPMHQSQQSVANWIASRHFLISCLGSKKNLPRMDSFTASFASVENTPQRFSSFSRTMPSHRSFLLQCFDRPTDWLTVVFRSLLRAPKFSQVHFVQTQHFFCAFVCKANCTEQRAVFFSPSIKTWGTSCAPSARPAGFFFSYFIL